MVYRTGRWYDLKEATLSQTPIIFHGRGTYVIRHVTDFLPNDFRPALNTSRVDPPRKSR